MSRVPDCSPLIEALRLVVPNSAAIFTAVDPTWAIPAPMKRAASIVPALI